ncbi:MAG: hypothetical protein V4850_35525 [Myxococcota bacterium]
MSTHLAKVKAKLGAETVPQIVRYAHRVGLVDGPLADSTVTAAPAVQPIPCLRGVAGAEPPPQEPGSNVPSRPIRTS